MSGRGPPAQRRAGGSGPSSCGAASPNPPGGGCPARSPGAGRKGAGSGEEGAVGSAHGARGRAPGRGQPSPRRRWGRRRCCPFKPRGRRLLRVESVTKAAAGPAPARSHARSLARTPARPPARRGLALLAIFPAALGRGSRRRGEAEPRERGPGRPRGAVAAVTAAPGPGSLSSPLPPEMRGRCPCQGSRPS